MRRSVNLGQRRNQETRNGPLHGGRREAPARAAIEAASAIGLDLPASNMADPYYSYPDLAIDLEEVSGEFVIIPASQMNRVDAAWTAPDASPGDEHTSVQRDRLDHPGLDEGEVDLLEQIPTVEDDEADQDGLDQIPEASVMPSTGLIAPVGPIPHGPADIVPVPRVADSGMGELRSQLPSLPLFSLPELSLVQMMDGLEVHYHEEGEIVVSEGDEVTRLFVILEGRVRARRSGYEGQILAEGEMFGEEALFGGNLATRTFECPDTCILLGIPAEGLRRVVDQHPQLLKLLTNSWCSFAASGPPGTLPSVPLG